MKQIIKNIIDRFHRRKKHNQLPLIIVNSLFFYGWNCWCKEECDFIFGYQSDHIWSKWIKNNYKLNGPAGAFELLYSDLGDNNRRQLIERALHCYCGNIERIESWK